VGNRTHLAPGFVLTLTLCGGAARAQPDAQQAPAAPAQAGELRPMEPDRPNKTNSARTIDTGHVQLEVGFFDATYTWARDGRPWESQAVFGQANVRVGVMDMLELNVIVNPLAYAETGRDSTGDRDHAMGFGDLVVGGKLNLWGNDAPEGPWATALGVQPQVKIPTANDDLGNGHVEVAVGVPFTMNLPEEIHLSVQPTVAWERNADDSDDHFGWQFAVALDRELFGVVDVYAEFWTHFAQDQKPQQTIDVGLSYPLSDSCVLDTGVNIGLNRATPDLEWTVGVSFRF
jgi:Putative MetA-pathway of phenol degradation